MKDRRGSLLLALILFLSFSAASCSRRGTAAPLPAPAAPPPGAVHEGIVSFKALADPLAPKPALPENFEIIAPYPITDLNPDPEYPPAALAASFGPATVGIRIFIGVSGAVTSIIDSPVQPSTPGPYAAEFRAEVEKAVRRWVFHPATARFFENSEDYDGDGKPDFLKLKESAEIPVYIDLRFDFEIVDGRGRVRGAGAGTHAD